MGWQTDWTTWLEGAALGAVLLAGAGREVQGTEGPGPARLVKELPPVRMTPRFVSLAPAMAREGRPYRYAIRALDPDGEPLTFTLVRAPEGAQLEGRVLVWVPARAQTRRRQQFLLRAVDEHGAARDQAWTVLARPRPRTLQQLRQRQAPPE